MTTIMRDVHFISGLSSGHIWGRVYFELWYLVVFFHTSVTMA